MRSLMTLLLIALVSCQSITNHKEDIAINSKSDSSLTTDLKDPLIVEYTNETSSDTMFLNFNNERLLITPTGGVFKGDKLLFEIKPEGNIIRLFFHQIGEDLVSFYVFSPFDGEAGSYAKRISINQNKEVWKTPIYAFNLARPVIIGDYAYISTLGFVGKLNLNNGKFAWKFDDLFKNGKYVRFEEPIFLKDSMVLFNEGISSSIIVDDKNGRIIKMTK